MTINEEEGRDQDQSSSQTSDPTGMHGKGIRDARGRYIGPPPNAWQPGVGGGGKGRPSREREVTEQARALTATALETLAEVMRDKKAQAIARVRAVEILFERAFGKAPQKIVLETDLAGMSNAALQGFLRSSLASVMHTVEAEVQEVPALPSPEHDK